MAADIFKVIFENFTIKKTAYLRKARQIHITLAEAFGLAIDSSHNIMIPFIDNETPWLQETIKTQLIGSDILY